MPSGRNFQIVGLTCVSRSDWLIHAVGMFDAPKLIGHFIVETLLNPCQNFDGSGVGQGALEVHLIDGPLNDDMRPRLQGERAGLLFKLRASKGSLNVVGVCIMTLNQV